jgi:hypothetical protein
VILVLLTVGEANVDTFIKEVINDAMKTLRKLLALKFRKEDPDTINFKSIHQALLEHPNGVLMQQFEEDGATGIPEKVCKHLQEFHAFQYHYPSGEYRYAGKEFENAARILAGQESKN